MPILQIIAVKPPRNVITPKEGQKPWVPCPAPYRAPLPRGRFLDRLGPGGACASVRLPT